MNEPPVEYGTIYNQQPSAGSNTARLSRSLYNPINGNFLGGSNQHSFDAEAYQHRHLQKRSFEGAGQLCVQTSDMKVISPHKKELILREGMNPRRAQARGSIRQILTSTQPPLPERIRVDPTEDSLHWTLQGPRPSNYRPPPPPPLPFATAVDLKPNNSNYRPPPPQPSPFATAGVPMYCDVAFFSSSSSQRCKL